jgi:copper homeostasis protein
MILEVCAYNIQSCMTAARAGASRIELCADPSCGGTTPSYGLVEYALANVPIPVFPMVRPRGGNFVYDATELDIMKRDIRILKELGCTGIATGIQLATGAIDTDALKRIVAWAYPMSVTCHKVFDVTHDAGQSLERVIEAGCSRILTSGLKKTAVDGAATIFDLVAQAAGRIIIMPGGSVRSDNIAELARVTGAGEFHSSGIIHKDGNYMADEQEVALMVKQLNGM